MTDASHVSGAGQAGAKPDSLTIFSHVWAAQSLVQLVFFNHWASEGLVLGYVFAALAIAVFVFPGRLWLFVPMVASSVIYFISQWPFVVNHVFIDTFMSLTMLASFAIIAVHYSRTKSYFSRDTAEAWFTKFAPVCGAIFAFMYMSIIISKLNDGFFDLEISCLSGMIEEAEENRSFISGPLSMFSVEFYFWFFIVAETALPIMLAFRRTRLAAFYFGVPFHVLLGLMGHWPFSSFMLSLYVLVAMPTFRDFLQTVFDKLDDIRTRIVPWAPGSLLFSAASALLLASVFVLKPSWIWLLWTAALCTLLMLAVLAEHFRHGLFKGTGATPFWTPKPGLLWVAFALVVVNSASPYIGFKTESNVAMYSNMRTEGGMNNHLFLPTVSLFGFQDNLVEVVDANHEEILKLRTHPARYGYVGQEFEVYVPYFEFRRVVSSLKAKDLEIAYIRNGEARTFRSGASDNVDANLDKAPPVIVSKLVHFRPVFKGERSYCLH